MSKTRKIKILSDGERFGSDIVDAETGETLRNVEAVTIRIEGVEPPQVTIEVLAPAMDITATAEIVQTGWIVTLYHQIKEMRALLLRCNDVVSPGFGATEEEREQTAQEIRALLEKYPADKEASDGK